MGRAVIITVGDEVLAGRTTDTNGTWLSARLREAGFPVAWREVVGDDPAVIAAATRRALADGDLVIVMGGLGPTPDDLTREGLASALGTRLERNSLAARQIRDHLSRFGRPVTEANLTQADLPVGTEPLLNTLGTAPGVWAEPGGRLLAALPGVPREMRTLAEEHVLPRLASHAARGPIPVRRAVTLSGLGESEVGTRISDLMKRGRNPSVGSYPGTASLVLVIEARDDATGSAESLVDRDVAEIRRRLGPVFVGEGELLLHEVVGGRLLELGRTIAVAESLTGGRVTDRLVSVPGISAALLAGLVTYADSAKQNLLGVSTGTLRNEGAVSEACAREMAEGVRRVAGADIGMSTTGIAGPTGAVPGKPVGTVFLGLALAEKTHVVRCQIPGDRAQIRDRSVAALLNLLRLSLG